MCHDSEEIVSCFGRSVDIHWPWGRKHRICVACQSVRSKNTSSDYVKRLIACVLKEFFGGHYDLSGLFPDYSPADHD